MEGSRNHGGLYHSGLQESCATDSLCSLRLMQEQGQLCDVILEMDTNRVDHIAAHRVVLAAASPYFKGMFVNNLLESTRRTICIKDVEPDILQAIVAYAYNADFYLPQDRVLPLMIAADLFQMISLRHECSTFLELHLEPENCLGLRAIADMHNCSSLFDMCTAYAADHFEQVVSSEEYLSLPPNQLKDLISRDKIRVTCEEQVYSAVLQWVYWNLESRRDEFPAIMSHVRLPFVSSQFLSGNVEREDLVRSEEQCQFYVQEAYAYKNSPEKRSLLRYSPRAKPRKPSGIGDMILTVGGMCKNHPISTVEQYDLSSDSWKILGQIKTPRFGLAACFHDCCMYAVGGYGEGVGYLDTLECYNIKEDKWSTLVSMKHPRRYHSVHVLYGLIYAVGGQNSKGILSSVECYNPDVNSWTTLQSMSTPRMYHGMADMDGYLFAVGGHSGQVRLDSVEFYNSSKDTWTYACPMSIPRSVAGVASLGCSIYAAGGYNGREYLNSVECYDIEMDRWCSCTSMNTSRSAMGLVIHDGCLYACGGFNGDFEASVEKYTPTTQSWKPCADMLIEKVHFGVLCT